MILLLTPTLSYSDISAKKKQEIENSHYVADPLVCDALHPQHFGANYFGANPLPVRPRIQNACGFAAASGPGVHASLAPIMSRIMTINCEIKPTPP